MSQPTTHLSTTLGTQGEPNEMKFSSSNVGLESPIVPHTVDSSLTLWDQRIESPIVPYTVDSSLTLCDQETLT